MFVDAPGTALCDGRDLARDLHYLVRLGAQVWEQSA